MKLNMEEVQNLYNTVKTLQQETEKLKAILADWKYEVKCHMDEVVVRDKEIERLKAKERRYIEALRKAKEAIKAAWSDGSVNTAMNKASEALTAIDKAIGEIERRIPL